MGNSAKRTTKAAQIAEQRRLALELRKGGMTYEQIRLALKCSVGAAHKMIARAIADIPREAAEQVRALELQRLDKMLDGLWKYAEKGDPRAVAAVVRLMDRRAAYLGLDAPKQTEVWGMTGPFDVEKALG